MKKLIISLATGLLFLGTASVSADTMELAEEKQCTSCHGQEDMTPRAPAFSSIAAKYSDGEMRGYLIDVVLKGGEDHWGSATMPEPGMRPEVTEAEAEKLVDWILGMSQQE